MLYRGMKPDPSDRSRPMCGACANSLGARIKHEPGPALKFYDIIAREGRVEPGTGGMSVVAEEFDGLPGHRLPKKFGGESEDHELFMLVPSSLPSSLQARADRIKNPAHRSIEPALVTTAVDYLRSLHGTKVLWVIVDNE